MSLLFGRRSPQDLVRENQRVLERSIRGIDREICVLESQDRKLMGEIKRIAKLGHKSSVKVLARDLVMTRRNIERICLMRAHLQGASIRLQTIKCNQTITEAMTDMTRALKSMNSYLNLPSVQNIMQEFELQHTITQTGEDLVDATLHNVMSEEDLEKEANEVVNRILEEAGIPVSEPNATRKGKSVDCSLDADLETRLENLRKI